MLNFAKHYAAVKGAHVEKTIVELVVAWDPKGAAEADISARDEQLKEYGTRLVRLRDDFNKEDALLQPKLKALDLNLAAAELLQKQVNDAAQGSSQRASLEASLNTLLAKIEENQPELEADRKDRDETKAWLDEEERGYQQAVTKVKSAMRDLGSAQRDMRRAEVRRDRSVQRAQDARAAAGFASSSPSKIDVALNAMRRRTDKLKLQGDAADLERQSFAPAPVAPEDPNIAAALAQVSGQSVQPVSSADRIAALRAKQGAPAKAA